MPFFSVGGKLIKSIGGLSFTQACCCDPPPPPLPICNCELFRTCTTTIEYAGLVFSFVTDSNSELDGFFGFRRSDIRWAGRQVYLGGNFEGQQPYTLFGRMVTAVCTKGTTVNTGPVSAQSFSMLCNNGHAIPLNYHFFIIVRPAGSILFVGNIPPAKEEFFAYAYEVVQDASLPCPSSLSGKQVRVRQVLRLDNGCDFDCAQNLQSFKDNVTTPVPLFSGNSFKMNPFAWGNNINDVAAREAVSDESWICDHPIWQEPARPIVSIACAP